MLLDVSQVKDTTVGQGLQSSALQFSASSNKGERFW